MRSFALGMLLLLMGSLAQARDCPATLDFSFRVLAGQQIEKLCDRYAGQVLLVVNTASRCGFTRQYDGLEALYRRYRERGFIVLGFPSNDFAQEPDSEQEIQRFCRLTYSVDFPMFEKLVVRADGAHPFYQVLAAQGGGYPQWNFHKYLLDRHGRVVASFPSQVEPDDARLIAAIEQLLN